MADHQPRHYIGPAGAQRSVCSACHDTWPCKAALLAENLALRGEVAELAACCDADGMLLENVARDLKAATARVVELEGALAECRDDLHDARDGVPSNA